MIKLASRIGKIKPSPTLAVTSRASALKAEGRDIIDFGVGEPDFDTPERIKAAAVDALKQGFTKYTPVGGTNDLKDAIIDKLKKDNRLTYNRSQICVSCGAKHSLYNLSQVLFEEGDEVIIPAPYWVSYVDMVLLAGAKPVIIDTSEANGFKMTPPQLEATISSRTKALILNSPSNPTGAVYSRTDLEILAEILMERNILVISDDIYEHILYDGFSFYEIAAYDDRMKHLTVVVNGVSKTYAMTGWRIGYCAGPADIIAAVTKIQSQSTSNATSIAQKAACEALAGDQQDVGRMVGEFALRRDVIVERLKAIDGMICLKPQGAFYVFPNVKAFFGRSFKGRTIAGSIDFAEFLLEEGNCAVVPGSAFGNDHYIRISYATSMQDIEKGLQRIKDAVTKLR
jgi:aspartate aminotransferase